jgi:hypothetical protein
MKCISIAVSTVTTGKFLLSYMWAFALVVGVGIWQKIANAYLVVLPVHTNTVGGSNCNIGIFSVLGESVSNM